MKSWRNILVACGLIVGSYAIVAILWVQWYRMCVGELLDVASFIMVHFFVILGIGIPSILCVFLGLPED